MRKAKFAWLPWLGVWALVFGVLGGCSQARRDWQLATGRDDIESYEWFVRQHAESRYIAAAEERLAALHWQDLLARRQTAGQTTAAVRQLIQRYATFAEAFGHLAQAEQAIASLDTLHWIYARRLDRRQDYEAYLKQRPASPLSAKALERLEFLQREALVFADPRLERAVKRAAGIKGRGEILRSDLAGLWHLDLMRYTGIKTLDGIEGLTAVRYLRLPRGTGALDWQALTHIEGLDSLVLAGNGVEDLTPLRRMEGLIYLDVSDNRLTSVAALSDLKKLRYLDLSYNSLSDLSPLAALTSLEQLKARDNQLEDLTPLGALEKLQELWLGSNRLTDLGPLAGLRRLQRLHLANNRIQQADLSNLEQLRWLHLANNELSALPVLGVRQMEGLHLANNRIRRLQGGGRLRQVEVLDLSQNSLSALDGKHGLSQVGTLDLHGNQLRRLAGLKALRIVRTLDLRENQLKDLNTLLDNILASGEKFHVALEGNPLQGDPKTLSQQRPAVHWTW